MSWTPKQNEGRKNFLGGYKIHRKSCITGIFSKIYINVSYPCISVYLECDTAGAVSKYNKTRKRNKMIEEASTEKLFKLISDICKVPGYKINFKTNNFSSIKKNFISRNKSKKKPERLLH